MLRLKSSEPREEELCSMQSPSSLNFAQCLDKIRPGRQQSWLNSSTSGLRVVGIYSLGCLSISSAGPQLHLLVNTASSLTSSVTPRFPCPHSFPMRLPLYFSACVLRQKYQKLLSRTNRSTPPPKKQQQLGKKRKPFPTCRLLSPWRVSFPLAFCIGKHITFVSMRILLRI